MALVVGEASSSSTPSTSIPLPRSWTYHVFLSFRGEDTRKTFTDHLYASLERKGIKTFRDDKDLERGEVISVELLKAIEKSMFAITVLSPSYASSTWCLDELQKIVECSKNLGLSVLPVFYGVEPSDVRYQRRDFEEAFKNHEERFGQQSEKVKRWRDALEQVASLSGWDSKHQLEAALVDSIAQHIHTRLIPKLPSCIDNLLGIASRVEEVNRLVDIGLNDIRFIGIWGMGGIGKTTIARAVYDAIQCEFQVSCFLANIREIYERHGLVEIQKQLVAHSHMSKFYNVDDGKKIIQNSFCNKKVLLVLDDISDESQLENLAEEKNWFGPGSRVIITTRDMHLLKTNEVYSTYEVRCLDENESLCFFCLKPFKQNQPEEEYWDMSYEVVKYTGGLPLALKVLGSYLHGRTVDIWHSAITKIKSVPHSKILDRLKISYDDLDFMEKNIFLDIACFFKGMEKDEVIDILEKCGYNPQIEIDVLIERSLVTINKETNELNMHDLLQEMGRNIVIQESPYDPGNRSRLWSAEDIDLVLTLNKEIGVTQQIVISAQHLTEFECYKERWRYKAFSNITQLKFLSLNGIEVPILANLPNSLKVLHWRYCPLKTLPLTDQQYELVEIKLPHSKIVQLWHGKKFLGKLKYLDLRWSDELKQTPDLSAAPLLKTLDLSECWSLISIHPSLIHHKNLVTLKLDSCMLLKTFPGKLEMSSLKELSLLGCSSLEKLPEFGECMKHLSRLSLSSIYIRELPISLGCLVALEELHLRGCRELSCLPDSIGGLKSLRILNVSYCPKFRGLQHSFSSLNLRDYCYFPSLTDLILFGGNFVRVPIRIHELPKLRRLKLNYCEKLEFLPELPLTIRELQAYGCASLNTSSFNNLSKACCVFASTSQDHGVFLQMKISGTEIPSWFVHRQQGNSVSVPLPHNCPQDERLGIALCFHLHLRIPKDWSTNLALVVCNGKEFVTKRTLVDKLPKGSGSYLHVLCFTNDYFSDEFHQNNRFELSVNHYGEPPKIFSSASRWVDKKDIEDLMKSEFERPEKNKIKEK